MRMSYLVCVLSIQIVVLGCTNAPVAVAPSGLGKSVSSGGVPSIEVVADCGKCEVSPEVIRRIGESYMNAAGAAGVRVSATETAILRIESFSDRGAGRLLVAAVAGPLALAFHFDRIEGTLISRGTQVPIRETARFPFASIDSVAKDVGEIAFAKLVNVDLTQSKVR
jgi:hypothetical protein